jgi:DNA-directed RNA polymerase specialized sigma24 family protein
MVGEGLAIVPHTTDERLSRIETHWTAVLRAHGGATDSARADRDRLLVSYSATVYRYLLGALRDADAAADLAQEFAVRFLRGDFRRAAPERGRFRDYVKTALINLVNDYHRAKQAGPKALAFDAAAPELPSEDDFVAGWRDSLLDHTWQALAEVNPMFHAVLLLRIENPDMQSPEMAERISTLLGRPVSPELVRKSLQRSHAKFADLLLDQVAKSLEDPTPEDLEAELQTLDLLRYCRSTLEHRRGKK